MVMLLLRLRRWARERERTLKGSRSSAQMERRSVDSARGMMTSDKLIGGVRRPSGPVADCGFVGVGQCNLGV
jgi:hypothetical protein